jgi:hypothetical protein
VAPRTAFRIIFFLPDVRPAWLMQVSRRPADLAG